MANGNEKLALRYQNKYRNALKSDVTLVNEVINEITNEKGSCYNPYSIVNDENVKKIEEEISALIFKIYNDNEKESVKLKKQVDDLARENVKLKKIINNTLVKKGLTNKYFKNDKLSNA